MPQILLSMTPAGNNPSHTSHNTAASEFPVAHLQCCRTGSPSCLRCHQSSAQCSGRRQERWTCSMQCHQPQQQQNNCKKCDLIGISCCCCGCSFCPGLSMHLLGTPSHSPRHQERPLSGDFHSSFVVRLRHRSAVQVVRVVLERSVGVLRGRRDRIAAERRLTRLPGALVILNLIWRESQAV